MMTKEEEQVLTEILDYFEASCDPELDAVAEVVGEDDYFIYFEAIYNDETSEDFKIMKDDLRNGKDPKETASEIC
jgi:DNA-binding ferritin-like protein (Dps family)